MPELEQVETPKSAGFVQTKSTRGNRKRIEEDEAELKELMEARNAPAEEPQEEVQQEEAAEPEEEKLSGEERTFKKRYGDLREHLNKQNEELKQLRQQLEGMKSNPDVRMPKSDEDIEAWAKKYPDVASIVETIADKKAKALFDKAEARLRDIDEMNASAKRETALSKIRKVHSDFDELKESDAFHDWAGEQPKWVQDALYENADDPGSVIRVIDLYKVDNGMDVASTRRNTKEAASAVKTRTTTKVSTETAPKFTESQVQRMSAQEYEKNADAIMEAMRSGDFTYDLSGGAR